MNNKRPEHLAIIMDGNRRWARKRGLATFVGHHYGAEKVEKVARFCLKRGIKILTLFAFSTENWSRPQEEIDYLKKLAVFFFRQRINNLRRMGVRIRIIGQRQRLGPELQRIIKRAERLTQANKKLILNLAVSYGGREEIVRAVKKIIKKGVAAEKVDKEEIGRHLYTAGLPDPDLLIRTSGEQRLSGFLLWQSAYAELYFSKKYWPDLTEKDLEEALADFARRRRRFGK